MTRFSRTSALASPPVKENTVKTVGRDRQKILCPKEYLNSATVGDINDQHGLIKDQWVRVFRYALRILRLGENITKCIMNNVYNEAE